MWSRRFWLILCTKGLASQQFYVLIFAIAVILLIFGPVHFVLSLVDILLLVTSGGKSTEGNKQAKANKKSILWRKQ